MPAIIEISPQSLAIDAATNVVKREEYTYVLDAEAIIAQAKAQARSIIAEAEDAKKQACDDGYQQGFAAAQQTQVQALTQTLAKCQEFFLSRQQDIATLVIDVSRKIIGEIDSNTRLHQLVAQALSHYSNVQHVTLCIAPQQFAVFSERLGELRKAFPSVSQLELKEDERVDVGSCLMETPIGVLNINLDAQLAAVESALLQ